MHNLHELWLPDDDVPENTSGLVTEGERAVEAWRRVEFLSNQYLSYSRDNDCQYLKNDTLFLVVLCTYCQF